MIKCPYCGYENNDDATFCVMCKEVYRYSSARVEGEKRPIQRPPMEISQPRPSWVLNWHSHTLYILLIIFVALLCYYLLEIHPKLVSMITYATTYVSPPRMIPLTPTKEEEAKEKMEVAYTMGDYSDILADRKPAIKESVEGISGKEKSLSDYKEVQYFVSDNYIYYSIGEFSYMKELTPEQKRLVEKGAIEKVVKEERPKIYIVEQPVAPALPTRKNVIHTNYGENWYLPEKTIQNVNLKRNLPKLFDVKRPRIDRKQIYLNDLHTETLNSTKMPRVSTPNLQKNAKIHLYDVHEDKVVIDKLNKDTVGRDRIKPTRVSN